MLSFSFCWLFIVIARFVLTLYTIRDFIIKITMLLGYMNGYGFPIYQESVIDYTNLALCYSNVRIWSEYETSVEYHHHVSISTVGLHIILSPPVSIMVTQENPGIVGIEPCIVIGLNWVQNCEVEQIFETM